MIMQLIDPSMDGVSLRLRMKALRIHCVKAAICSSICARHAHFDAYSKGVYIEWM